MSVFRIRALELWSAFNLYRLTAAQRARAGHVRRRRLRVGLIADRRAGVDHSRNREIARRQRQIARGTLMPNEDLCGFYACRYRKRIAPARQKGERRCPPSGTGRA